MDAIPTWWGEVELEPEVQAWLMSLNDSEFGTAAFAINLLARDGVLLGEPATRQLDGKLRELLCGRTTATYHLLRRIILLTVFPKTRPKEKAEVERAWQAMVQCIERRHTVEGDEDD